MRKYSRFFLCAILILVGGAFLSCKSGTDDLIIEPPTEVDSVQINSPSIKNAVFKAYDNPQILIEDVKGEIIGDSTIEFWIPYILPGKVLMSDIEFEGESLLWEDSIVSEHPLIDFKAPVKLSVIGIGNIKKDYMVYVHSFTGLPIIWIETENRKEILSKTDYVNAHMKLVENVTTRSLGSTIESELLIKCRGASSFRVAPKKSYRLKFDKKISLLDEPKDKAWVLIANYFDKTMIRNMIAYYMGKISNLDYTPRFHYVDMMLNGKYNGTYMLGDKLKESKDRVNVGSDGFLLEFNNDIVRYGEEGVYFYIDSIKYPIEIKEPEVTVEDSNYNYIKDYLKKAEQALFSENFKDPENGWQKYMDITSFVDWFIIHEIAKCPDSEMMAKSCFMNLKRGGKLKMGPLWDFDQSLGNQNVYPEYSPEGFEFEGRKVKWFIRLFEDPAFRSLAKERFSYFYGRKDDIQREINANAQYLKYSVVENDNKWPTLYEFMPSVNRDVWGSYQNEVQHLKNWLNLRFEWLKEAFDNLD